MRLERVELRRLRLPLVAPFRTAAGLQRDRDVLVVKVTTDLGEGWGECAALGEPTYTSEYTEGARHVIRRHLLPRLLGRELQGAEEVAEALRPVRGHPMARACLEMALLDAELRARGEPLARHLGAVRSAVDCGAAIGLKDSIGHLLEAVEGALAAGYRRVKLKIEPGWDLEPVQAVRERFGPIPLQVDANGAYELGDLGRLARLDHLDLLMIEQPFAEDDLRAHVELARRLRTPICLDESITSARAAATAIVLGACSIVNLKPGRVGGYFEARRVHDVCQAHGVPVWVGGMLETGLGRAANLALAALPNCVLPGDLSAADRHLAQDLTDPPVMRDGRLPVPTGAGIGITVDEERVSEFTVELDVVGPERPAPPRP
ncbi:MAG TPA: o-succinylbenzoate synthase [Candidatus Dormibacteraeota bacterium]|nr:o-succinylbenzoate synthase [Candidatus Dormibacteraeota bacterium]